MYNVSRIGVMYYGNKAEHHALDAREFSDSLSGASRVYTALSYSIIEGKIPGRRTQPITNVLVSPPRHGSFATDLLVDVIDVAGAFGPILALNAEIVKNSFGLVLEWTMSTIGNVWRDDAGAVSEALEVVKQMGIANAAISSQAIDALNDAGKREHETTMRALQLFESLAGKGADLSSRVHSLADATRPAGLAMVAPVDRSCEVETHSIDARKTTPIRFGRDIAERLRAASEDVIGPLEDFRVFVSALDKNNSTGRMEFASDSPIYRAKIADPAFTSTTHSVYTRALDSGSRIIIRAKPVFNSDGELKSFHVMDAIEEDRRP